MEGGFSLRLLGKRRGSVIAGWQKGEELGTAAYRVG